MIEINLLPPEMRKVDRTSMKRLLIMVTAVVLLSASALGGAFEWKRHSSEAAVNTSLAEQMRGFEKLVKEYDTLSAELKEVQLRTATIEEIRTTRLRWGKKLDQLYAILPPYVWFDKIDLKTVRAAGAGATGQNSKLVLDCYLAGSDERRYAEFRRILAGEIATAGPYSGAEFYKDFSNLGWLGWLREDVPGSDEGVALKFTLELDVKHLGKVEEPKKAARPTTSAATAKAGSEGGK